VGAPLDAFTDRRAGFEEIAGQSETVALTDAVRAASSDEARFAVVQAFVRRRIAESGRSPDPVVERCAEAIADSEGRIAMEALERLSGLGVRQLQRRFAAEVGLPPRLLASVVRFRRVFVALKDRTTRNWTEAAQAAGYFDHPQMARDFRRFVGCTPSQFLAAREGLATSLVDLPQPQGSAVS
jgi:AraC-like DNA-binding protein